MAGNNNLSAAQIAKMKEIVVDPVKWAQVFLVTYDGAKKCDTPWIARWYQSEALRDPSLKKVLRQGRRTGKCLPGWVKIFDPTTGERLEVQKLYNRQQCNLVTMTDDYKLKSHNTNIIFENGVKDVFKVTLKSGRELDATGNHPLYTINGWEDIDNLKAGDKIAVPEILNFFGTKEINEECVKFLAYMIGDGNCTLSSTIRFTVADNIIKEDMSQALKVFECQLKQYESNSPYDYNIVKSTNTNNKTYPNMAKEYLKENGLLGKDSHNKTIPDIIFQLNKQQIALFINRLYATDGWASSRNNTKPQIEIGYCSVNKELLLGLQHLLLRFGIKSSINTKKVKYNGGYNTAYQLIITDKKSVLIFANEINIYSKENAVKKCVETASLIKDIDTRIVPILNELEEDRANKNIKKKDFTINNSRYRGRYNPSKSSLYQYGKILNNKRFMDLGTSDILWDEIVSIEFIGQYMTYDLTVPETHNFLAEDIITHNTEVMVVDMLWRAFTRRNYRCLTVTPYENQVRLQFQRLRELIDASPLLKAEVVSMTKNPYAITFKNHSSIFGFTTGASSGSGAASIRGQRADWLYMDEVDYMNDADFDSVTAIAAERNDIGITMSSTPTGRRSQFWKACTVKEMGYTEHYHPSMHNPNWGPEMEAELRAQLSEQGYIHEVLAEFGTEDAGVFDKDKVDKAMTYELYAYNDLDYYQQQRCREQHLVPKIYNYPKDKRAHHNPFRTFGIDWDRNKYFSKRVA